MWRRVQAHQVRSPDGGVMVTNELDVRWARKANRSKRGTAIPGFGPDRSRESLFMFGLHFRNVIHGLRGRAYILWKSRDLAIHCRQSLFNPCNRVREPVDRVLDPRQSVSNLCKRVLGLGPRDSPLSVKYVAIAFGLWCQTRVIVGRCKILKTERKFGHFWGVTMIYIRGQVLK
jgi:hypothetical protein